MKTFTVEEANDLIPVIEPQLREMSRLYATIVELREGAKAAAAASERGGGMPGGTRYVDSLYRVGKLVTEISKLGVEIKDHVSGLIDFPSLRGGRVIYLCWQLGENPSIEWWHEVDAGFAGRRPL